MVSLLLGVFVWRVVDSAQDVAEGAAAGVPTDQPPAIDGALGAMLTGDPDSPETAMAAARFRLGSLGVPLVPRPPRTAPWELTTSLRAPWPSFEPLFDAGTPCSVRVWPVDVADPPGYQCRATVVCGERTIYDGERREPVWCALYDGPPHVVSESIGPIHVDTRQGVVEIAASHDHLPAVMDIRAVR